MLSDFVISKREEIIEQARARVALRTEPKPTEVELRNGIPVFVDQLADALRSAQSGGPAVSQQMDASASQHGGDLFRLGLTIGQVVHDYGDVCQAVTELAVQTKAAFSPADFKILNLCLDEAIAMAVSEYARQSDLTIKDADTERLGVLAHELRNLLNVSILAFSSIKSGRVAVGGSTGAVLDRSLCGMRDLIDRALADVRLDAGIDASELISVAHFVVEVEIGANLEAKQRAIHFTAPNVDAAATIKGDRQILLAAVANLIQNAIKFTKPGGHVSLVTRISESRVCFEVQDECGGLPPGKAEALFAPFLQKGHDRTGLGLGLSICLKAAKANSGELRVRDLPGKGCEFTLDLPRCK